MNEIIYPFEIFKVSTYPGIEQNRYLVGNLGNIYDKKINKYKATSCNNRGYVYGSFNPYDNDGKKTIAIHRLVAWEHVDGYCEETSHTQVDHNDYTKDNNYYKNLEWVTQAENNKRRYNNKENYNFINPPTYYGPDHPRSVHDVEIITRICKLLSEGKSVIGTFYEFGYTAQSQDKKLYNLIYDIKNKRSWTQVSDDYF